MIEVVNAPITNFTVFACLFAVAFAELAIITVQDLGGERLLVLFLPFVLVDNLVGRVDVGSDCGWDENKNSRDCVQSEQNPMVEDMMYAQVEGNHLQGDYKVGKYLGRWWALGESVGGVLFGRIIWGRLVIILILHQYCIFYNSSNEFLIYIYA